MFCVAIVVWLYIALSPVLFLLFVLRKRGEVLAGGDRATKLVRTALVYAGVHAGLMTILTASGTGLYPLGIIYYMIFDRVYRLVGFGSWNVPTEIVHATMFSVFFWSHLVYAALLLCFVNRKSLLESIKGGER